MAKDLINRKSLLGQTRSQLVQLLGDPENYRDTTDRELYYLIREDWDWIDPSRRDHLLITLDQNGRAVDTKITVIKRNAD